MKVDEPAGRDTKGQKGWRDVAMKKEREMGIMRVMSVAKKKRLDRRQKVKNREKTDRSTKRLNLNDA